MTHYNYCRKCGFGPDSAGFGTTPDPDRKWWQFWKVVTCDTCGGDGYAKPPGWPDRLEIDRLRPPVGGSAIQPPVPWLSFQAGDVVEFDGVKWMLWRSGGFRKFLEITQKHKR